MSTTAILFKGKIYAFGDEYPDELKESLQAQGKNHFGQKTTLTPEQAKRLNKGKTGQGASDLGKGANRK